MDNSINKLALAITTIIFAGLANADVTPQGTGATSDASSVAIGDNSNSVLESVAVGENAEAVSRSVAVGADATATDISTAVGKNSSAELYSTAIGSGARATNSSVAIGAGAGAGLDPMVMSNAVAIGAASQATALETVAIGYNARATAWGALAFGKSALASTNDSIAIGQMSEATGWNAIAMGFDAEASGNYSLAFGTGARAPDPFTVSFGGSGLTRRIVGISAGIADTDAVNVGQMKAITDAMAADITNLDQRITVLEGGTSGGGTGGTGGTGGGSTVDQTYVDNSSTTTLNSANSYTDARYDQAVQEAVQESKAYTDREIAKTEKFLSAGIAAVAAQPMLPALQEGQKAVAVGTGHYNGANAVGVSFGYAPRSNIVVSGGVSGVSGEGKPVFRTSASYVW